MKYLDYYSLCKVLKQFPVIILSFYIAVTSALFTSVPLTQYVYVNDVVTYECATNVAGYTITLFFGTNVMETVTDIQNGKRVTFTAAIEFNSTYVFCFARMGTITNSTNVAYLYIQGNPLKKS